MRAGLVASAFAVLALLPAGAAAQQTCNVASGGITNILNQGQPTEIRYMGGGVTFNCPDGRLIKSDSVIMVAANEQRLLIGHAYYADKEKTLTADQINYMGAAGHLFAQWGATQEKVVLTDNVNGAVISGQYLDYYPAKNGQPSRAQVFGQTRPHAVLKRKPAAPAPRTAAPAGATPAPVSPTPVTSAPATPAPVQPADTAPTLVDADRMEIQGQRQFHAIGNVVLTRLDMKGTAADGLYDPDADHLRLSGNAIVTGGSAADSAKQFTLSGGTIDGDLVGNEFKDVTATSKATLVSKDLRVNAPILTVAFDSGQVQRMVALSAERAKRTATDGQVLAEAWARQFHLIADSIDAKAPGQKLEQVVAVGRAYGESQNDSIKVKMPDIASKDWLKGDTITGFFIDAPAKSARPANGANGASGRNGRGGRNAQPAERTARNGARPGQPTGAAPADTIERVLDRVVAVGTEPKPASSMYRIVDDKKPQGTPDISYALAKRIEIAFRDGAVHEVKLEGGVRGVHLQAQPPKPKPKDKTAPKNATPSDSTRAGNAAAPAHTAPKNATTTPSSRGSGRS